MNEGFFTSPPSTISFYETQQWWWPPATGSPIPATTTCDCCFFSVSLHFSLFCQTIFLLRRIFRGVSRRFSVTTCCCFFCQTIFFSSSSERELDFTNPNFLIRCSSCSNVDWISKIFILNKTFRLGFLGPKYLVKIGYGFNGTED
jgi:hypothetical protein